LFTATNAFVPYVSYAFLPLLVQRSVAPGPVAPPPVPELELVDPDVVVDDDDVVPDVDVVVVELLVLAPVPAVVLLPHAISAMVPTTEPAASSVSERLAPRNREE
jgi:hypothetical protein